MNLKPHELNNLSPSNFIAGWYIDPALCDAIVETGNTNAHLFGRAEAPRSYNWVDMARMNPELNNLYCRSLWWAMEHYKEMFPYCYVRLREWGFTVPIFQQYNPGDSYSDAHCENDGREGCEYRHLAYMTYLNDIEEGGGTEFIHQNLITSPKKGLTLIWPATWTHYHKGVVAPSETKNILTGWGIFNI